MVGLSMSFPNPSLFFLNGSPIRSGMTFYLSFPNVSIGNPESSERLKKEWIPFFKGMTKKQGNDKREWIPDQVGDDRE